MFVCPNQCVFLIILCCLHPIASGVVSALTYGHISNTSIAVSWNIPQEPNGLINGYRLSLKRGEVVILNNIYGSSVPVLVTLNILSEYKQDYKIMVVLS